ncbi:MAG: hypothetical protein ACREQ5_04620 [Candidatus Dormibacteria bacterium]
MAIHNIEVVQSRRWSFDIDDSEVEDAGVIDAEELAIKWAGNEPDQESYWEVYEV